MESSQKFAIILPPILTLSMFFVFQGFAKIFGNDLAWHLGFLVYWPVFCAAVPVIILGRKQIRSLYSYRKSNWINSMVLLIPILITTVGFFFKGVFNFRSTTAGNSSEIIILIAMSFGNGFFEEILWRGLFSTLFQKRSLWGFLWPTIWFSLWHLAPGSLSHNFSPVQLVAGALVFGICWGFVAYRTKSIVATSVSHTLTGLVSIILR